jgi:hypothetical protein
MYWTSAKAYEYNFAEFSGTQVDMRHVIGDKYPSVRYLQLLLVSDDIFTVNSTADSLSSPTSPVNFEIGIPRLSTIPEKNASEVSSISDTALLSVFGDINETNKLSLTQALLAIQQEPCVDEPKIDLEVCTDSRTFWTCELNETDEASKTSSWKLLLFNLQ